MLPKPQLAAHWYHIPVCAYESDALVYLHLVITDSEYYVQDMYTTSIRRGSLNISVYTFMLTILKWLIFASVCVCVCVCLCKGRGEEEEVWYKGVYIIFFI